METCNRFSQLQVRPERRGSGIAIRGSFHRRAVSFMETVKSAALRAREGDRVRCASGHYDYRMLIDN